MSKFKAGDKVRALYNSLGFTKGNIYTVAKKSTYSGGVHIEVDDRGSKTNGWAEKNFELVKEKHYKWDIQIHTIEAKLYPNGHYEEHKKEWKISDHYVSEDKINDYINQYFIPQYECQILEFHKIESSFKEE